MGRGAPVSVYFISYLLVAISLLCPTSLNINSSSIRPGYSSIFLLSPPSAFEVLPTSYLNSNPPQPPFPTMSSDDEKKGVSPATSAFNAPVSEGQVVKRRFPGFSLEVRQEESSFATTKSASNADFDPIPPSKRTWNWGAYVAYWMADAWAVSNWEVGELIEDFLRHSVSWIVFPWCWYTAQHQVW